MRALVLAVTLCVPSLAYAQSVREVAARVHEQGDYGETLRVGPAGGGPSITYGGGAAGPAGDRDARPSRHRAPTAPSGTIDLGGGSAVVSWALMTIAIAVVVLLLVALLVRVRPREGELAPALTARERRADAASSPLPGRVIDLDADPDALAAEGRLAEAITAALVRSLLAVGWRPEGHGKSRTAREILASVGDGHERSALDELVSIEERIAFAGDEATRDRWQRARARWRDLEGSIA